jgi:hypothetical protein
MYALVAYIQGDQAKEGRRRRRRRAKGSKIGGAKLSERSCDIRLHVPEGKACRSRNTKGENMTAKRYKYVLQRLFIPFYERMRAKYGDEVVMQEDNALWHTAKIITRYLKNKKIRWMNWPP